jgi:hypothetical protein
MNWLELGVYAIGLLVVGMIAACFSWLFIRRGIWMFLALLCFVAAVWLSLYVNEGLAALALFTAAFLSAIILGILIIEFLIERQRPKKKGENGSQC